MEDKKQQSQFKKIALNVLKWLIALAIVWFTGKQIVADLKNVHDVKLNWLYLIASGAAYTLGMFFLGLFWGRAANDMGGSINTMDTTRGYIISQLGKYVPSKMFGMIIRCGIADKDRMPHMITIISTFYETFSMMGIGSLVAFIALLADWLAGGGTIAGLLAGIMGRQESAILVGAALVLTIGLVGVSQPPVFQKLVGIVAMPFKRDGDTLAKPVRYETYLKGIMLLVAGWLCYGFSTVFAAAGVGVDIFNLRGILLSIGGTGLSIAGGFVILIVPAGLGAREYIMKLTLTQVTGINASIAALVAVVTRIMYVVVEVVLSAILYATLLLERKNDKHSSSDS